MMALRIAIIFAILSPSVAKAVGFATSDNFAVYSPDRLSRTEDQKFAETLLQKAEQFRREVAIEWLGSELPAGAGESAIYLEFTSMVDRGRTWAIDYPGREFHNVYLRTSPENATGSTLHHEIVHTVMATAFPHPNRLPQWVEEGIASRYDDDIRKDAREQMRRVWVRGQHFPSLTVLIEATNVRSVDEYSYAASTSVVAYLLTLADPQTLVEFARDGQSSGWDWSLRTHYQIGSIPELQDDWQGWLADNPGEG